MLEVLKQASENVFVPLTVGGGIRGFTDAEGKTYSALEVASEYFRSGADKVSIGGDAVEAAEEYMRNNVPTGNSCIEQISRVYGAQVRGVVGLTTVDGDGDGHTDVDADVDVDPRCAMVAVTIWRDAPSVSTTTTTLPPSPPPPPPPSLRLHHKVITRSNHAQMQAVVISVDPRRVWVSGPDETSHATIRSESKRGPNGEEYCWWQCTIKGGREGRDVDVVQLATISEALGAGEILLNCIDNDGVGQGFDIELVRLVSDAVSIPVIASSGAGVPEHFSEVFEKTKASAGLAAGIFHRREVGIDQVKEHLRDAGVRVRI